MMIEELLVRIRALEREVERLRVQELGPQDVILGDATKLTSTSWDGDAFATVAKTLIDMSAVFGTPGGIKQVNLRVTIRDSGAAAADATITFGDTTASGVGKTCRCPPGDDRWLSYDIWVPCNADGDIYYQTVATGGATATLDVSVQVWGWKKYG